MRPISINIDDKEHIVFFTGANPEVQRILLASGKTEQEIYPEIAKSFRVTCLLADLVLQSSSNYYEVSIAKRLVRDYRPLFSKGIAVFVIRKDHGDFYTDRHSACSGYPQTDDYRGYFGSEGDINLCELQKLGFVYHRTGSMGRTIDNVWADGLLNDSNDETILHEIENDTSLNTSQKDKLIHVLQSLPVDRGDKAFIWDIVENVLHTQSIEIPKHLSDKLRFYLLNTYLKSASNLYNLARISGLPSIYFGNVIKEHATVHRYNPHLFLAFCETMNIGRIIENLKAEEIVQLKTFLEFPLFRNAYFKIVDEAKSIEKAKIALLTEYLEEGMKSLVLKHSFDALSSTVKESTSCQVLPNSSQQISNAYYLKDMISNPSSLSFILMKDRILESYSNRLDHVVSQHNSGNHLTQFNLTINNEGGITMGDKYLTNQAGAVGPGAQAQHINFSQTWLQIQSQTDTGQLASELGRLREHLLSQASSPDETIEVGMIANAEKEARSGNGPKALEYLSKAGKWSLGVAEKIGVGVAVAAIKAAIGL